MSGIRRSANRPKLAKHLRTTSSKHFENTTKEQREARHGQTDAWAEKQRQALGTHEKRDEGDESEDGT